MTARQFLAMGEDPPGVRLELVNGEIAVAPSPTPEHSNADGILFNLLMNHVLEHDLGMLFRDLDTPLDMFNVRRPDILFFSTARLQLVTRKALNGPPDLAVEIISSSSATVDRVDKFEQYKSAGVAYYWIVDPKARSFEAYRLHRGNYALLGEGRESDVVSFAPFPKLKIPLKKLWWPESTSSTRGRKPRNGNGH